MSRSSDRLPDSLGAVRDRTGEPRSDSKRFLGGEIITFQRLGAVPEPSLEGFYTKAYKTIQQLPVKHQRSLATSQAYIIFSQNRAQNWIKAKFLRERPRRIGKKKRTKLGKRNERAGKS